MTRSLPDHLFSPDVVRFNLSESKLDLAYIEAIDSYARSLAEKDLPIILDHEWLSQLVGYNTKTLYAIAACQPLFYHSYTIGKRSGGARPIDEPLPTLKSIQRTLLRYICCKMPVHKSSYAFRVGNTIRKNARIHLRQNEIIKLDIENFFGSVRERSVTRAFYDLGYTSKLSSLFARLCTINGSLAQGSPTSPALSNAVMYRIDDVLFDHFTKKGMRYTRYADDLTISAEKVDPSDIAFVSNILASNQFRLNRSKTKIFRKGASKIVTGVQVDPRIRAPRALRDRLRSEIYFIERYGLPSHAARREEKPIQCLQRLEGQMNFALWVDPDDKQLIDIKKRLKVVRADVDAIGLQRGD